MNARTLLVGATLALTVVACEAGDDQETGSISRDEVQQAREDLDPAVLAALDSGNTAYREGRYEDALAFYRDASAGHEDVAAAWFGIYMAQLALGNTEAADSAMQRAQSSAPGASLIHPTDTTP